MHLRTRIEPRVREMESLQKESCIRGYHIYQQLWTAAVGEHLTCQRERGNTADAYAVSVIKDGTIVGHLPRRISCACTLFMRRGGTIGCQVTGTTKYSAISLHTILFDVENISRVLIIRRGKYFACSIFNVRGTDEIFLPPKISRSTVCHLWGKTSPRVSTLVPFILHWSQRYYIREMVSLT